TLRKGGRPIDRCRASLGIVLVVTLLLAAGCGGASLFGRREEPGVRSVQSPLPSFTATDQLGRAFSDTDLAGKVAVAGFIYTQCSAVCPLNSAQRAKVQDGLERLDVLGSEAVLLSGSTDRFRDTSEVHREYAERFAAHPEDWLFLTGPRRAWIVTIQQGY